MPCTPSASIVLRSAWIPAPPPESDPATVSTRGIAMRSVSRSEVVMTGRSGVRLPVDGEAAALRHGADAYAVDLRPRRQRRDQRVVVPTRQRPGKRVDTEVGSGRGQGA